MSKKDNAMASKLERSSGWRRTALSTLITVTLLAGCAQNRLPKKEAVTKDSSQQEVIALETTSDAESPFQEEVENNSQVQPNIPGAANVGDGAALVGLRIDGSAEEFNSVVVDLSASPEYEVDKTAPSEFIVRLKNTQFDEGKVGPVLADSTVGAIRSVRASLDGQDTVLRVFSDPKYSLEVKSRSDGSLTIIPSTDPTQLVVNDENFTEFKKLPMDKSLEKEIRAQLEDKSEEKAGKAVITKSDTSRPIDQVARSIESEKKYIGRLISLDLQDTDIDNALRIIAEVSNLNIIASEDVQGKVTLRLIDVPWDQALDVILKTNGLDMVQEGNVVRIAPVEKLRAEREALKQAKQAEDELEELEVKYIRISYAKSADLKPLIDNVLTERGASTFDERTNQIIVKDISRGIKNVVSLVQKLDLRTPQILLETQIIEAQRGLERELGSRLGFQYVQSPQTGNATGSNFPNSVDLSGAIANAQPQNLNPITILLGSADGTKSLATQLTSFEREGKVKIISKPSVATTNNKQALIKSVEKVRIRLPNGGVSVATGQGASAAGQGQAATEVIEIGIALEVTPQASPDYYVLLDINAKSSTFSQASTEGIPNEVERSATSSVLVSSGQTFALGGIYKLTERTTNSGLPFFKDIPVFGTFFRLLDVEAADEELLFFITPRIIEGSFDDSVMRAVS